MRSTHIATLDNYHGMVLTDGGHHEGDDHGLYPVRRAYIASLDEAKLREPILQ